MRTWLWPIIIFCGALLMTLSVAMDWTIRPWVTFGFVLFCPGMALVRFMRLPDLLTEVGLAVAASMAITVMGLQLMLYLRFWSPITALYLLIGFCCISAVIQLRNTL